MAATNVLCFFFQFFHLIMKSDPINYRHNTCSNYYFWAPRSRRYTITTVDKQDERVEFRIWDKECYLPVKVVTVYAFGRVDVRPAPDGKPDAIEFCPGGRPTGLSSESSEAIAALLGRVAADIKAD